MTVLWDFDVQESFSFFSQKKNVRVDVYLGDELFKYAACSSSTVFMIFSSVLESKSPNYF